MVKKKLLGLVGVVAVSAVIGVSMSSREKPGITETTEIDSETETEDFVVNRTGWDIESEEVVEDIIPDETERELDINNPSALIEKLNVVEYNFEVLEHYLSDDMIQEIIDGLSGYLGNGKRHSYGGIYDYYINNGDDFTFYFIMDTDDVYEISCTYNELYSIKLSDLKKQDLIKLKLDNIESYADYTNDISALASVMTISKYQDLRDYIQSNYEVYSLLGMLGGENYDTENPQIVFYINTDKGILRGVYLRNENEYSLTEDSRSLADVMNEIYSS